MKSDDLTSCFFPFSPKLAHFLAAPPADTPFQENGEANGELKEPVDPNAPKKCDVIVLSGRKERCEAAVEALKVYSSNPHMRKT